MAELMLKNIPKPLYQRLRQTAAQNHRSLEHELIASLEFIYGRKQINPQILLQKARTFRSKVLGQLTEDKLFLFKNQGRV